MDCSLLCAALLGTVMVSIVDAQDSSPAPSKDFDVIITNGTVYDGSGAAGRQTDVALRGDRIAGVGDFKDRARQGGDRRARAGGRARFYQHAFVVE